MKMILIISDGIGDAPISKLQSKTPLEYGSFPSLDRLAREGITGIMDPLRPGIPAGSDTAHISLLGENPYSVYKGRGFLEALGVGLELEDGDIGFRVNFATLKNGIVIDRRAGRAPDGIHELADEINNSITLDVPFLFKEATGTRAALVLKGDGLSSNISDSDPHSTDVRPLEVKPLDSSREAAFTAELINDFISKTHMLLNDHKINSKRIGQDMLPSNYLLVRGAGVRPPVLTLKERYGISAACIAATALIRGVAKCYGFDILEVEGMTGEYNTNEENKAKATIKALDSYDFVFMHFKPTDTASHDGDPLMKIKMLKKLDRIVGIILDKLSPDDVIIALTGDHSSPCSIKDHSGEPVPVALWGGRVRIDDVSCFDERICAKGGLGRINATDIIPMLLNQANRIKKFGA